MAQVCGEEKAILISISEDKEYDSNNKPTGKIIGTKYSVVCPKRQYATVTVKVPDLVPVITQEALDGADNPVWITFDGFSGRLYQMNGDIGITCRAEKAILVKDGGKGHEKS